MQNGQPIEQIITRAGKFDPQDPSKVTWGTRIDSAGKPAVGAAVWLVGGSSEDSPKTLETAVTDAQGRFVFREAKARFARPKSGVPHLVARDTQGRLGGEPYPWAWSWATPTPRRDVRIKLLDVRDHPGRLLDAAGQPIPKAMIRPQTIDSAGLDDPAHRGIGLSPELTKERECETGADGTFTLRRLPVRGSVVCKVTAAGFGSPWVAWDLTDSVTLRIERVGGIRGTLVAGPGATGLNALKLYLYSNPSPAQAKSPGPRVYYSATTLPGKDGKFGFDDVPPGSCTIDPALYSSNLPYYVQGRTSFEVKPGQTASISTSNGRTPTAGSRREACSPRRPWPCVPGPTRQ